MLYNGYVIASEKQIAPAGWHIATDADWKKLETSIGMTSAEANQMGWRGEGLAQEITSLYSAGWAEGVPLFGSNATGFNGVVKELRGQVQGVGKYKAQIREDGILRHLGMFSTPEEAALCYARHAGAERAAAEAAVARAKRPQSHPADEGPRTDAAAKGPTLVPLLGSATGFTDVMHSGMNQAPNVENGKKRHLGAFTTPVAALSYARHARPYRSAAEAAEEAAYKVGERVVVWFEDVGWFPGVVDAVAQHSACQRYEVSFDDGDHRTDVRPIEMRLESQMNMNAESQSQSAMEQRVRVERPQLLTAARAASNVELSSRGETGSKGVMKDKSRCTAFTSEDGKTHQRFREVSTSQMQPVDEAGVTMPRWMRPKVGDRIQGKYQGQIGGRNWYDGVVTAVHEDGTCDLHYDDGDYEERVAPRFVKVIASAMDSPLPRPPSSTASLDAQPRPASSGSNCKICHLGHGSCRRRGAPGHLEKTEEVPRDSHSHLKKTEELDEPEELEEAQPLTADEARAAAAAERLELVLASTSETGFRCVRNHFAKYQVQIKENGKQRHLGIFATPEEAALCYARHIGAKHVEAAVAEARGKQLQPLTVDEASAAAVAEARAAAAAERLELLPSSSSEEGFKGVANNRGKYKATIGGKGIKGCTICRLGLRGCRHRGAPGHLEETSALPRDSHSHLEEARGEGPQPLPADESVDEPELPMEFPEAERHLPLKKRKLGPEAG